MSRFDFSFSKSNQDLTGATSVGVGIDFGTTNSAAAIFDGSKIMMVQLEEHNAIMPSATYIDKNLQTITGQAAIDEYIKSNMGRKVELSAELLGETNIFTGTSDPTEPLLASGKVYSQAMHDKSQQGRLFRGTKRLLGDGTVYRLMVFDKPFRLVALLTPLLLRIRKATQLRLADFHDDRPAPADYACIGHPVNFEGRGEHHNRLALQRLAEAYNYAGITTQTFCPEPVAATLSYLVVNPDTDSKFVLTVDFGGGTLDFCILKRNDSGFEVIATYGIGLGGDHIDQRLFRELLFPLLGKGERWQRLGMEGYIDTPFPFSDYEELLVNWAVSYMLNQNKYTAPIMDCIAKGGRAAKKFCRLRDLIQHNFSYLIFQAIKDFKARLSTEEKAVLDIPEVDVKITLTRPEFENMIADQLSMFEQAVQTILDKASIQASEIDLVLRTGGSSLIPAVTRILNKHFPGKVVEHDAFTGVASGLAIASYYGYDFGKNQDRES